MSAEALDVYSMARSKLNSAMNGSLHRWVLLKNSIFRPPLAPVPHVAARPSSNHVYIPNNDGDNEDDSEEDELDSFMFPDACNLVTVQADTSEAKWLDSLLESLSDGGEDDCPSDTDVRVSVVPVEDDEDSSFSPLPSPTLSSDDLHQHTYFSSSVAVPYPVPYPPFHPPLLRPYVLSPTIESPLSPSPAYDALPYYDTDELDDLSVPDAIEDTSDDESDAPSTPSLGHSVIEFVDPPSMPLPGQRRSQRRLQPRVYIHTPDSYLDRFALDLDPLPFPDQDDPASYNAVYHEC